MTLCSTVESAERQETGREKGLKYKQTYMARSKPWPLRLCGMCRLLWRHRTKFYDEGKDVTTCCARKAAFHFLCFCHFSQTFLHFPLKTLYCWPIIKGHMLVILHQGTIRFLNKMCSVNKMRAHTAPHCFTNP